MKIAITGLVVLSALPLYAQPTRTPPVTVPAPMPAAAGPEVLYSVIGEYQGILRARFTTESGTCVLATEVEPGGPSKWRLCAVEFDEDNWTHRRLPPLLKECRAADVDERIRYTWHAPDRFGCRIAEFLEPEDLDPCTPTEPCRR